MADNPQLVVAITARLDQFEKQLKEAGLIAGREVAAIERNVSSTDIFQGMAQGLGQQLTQEFMKFVQAIPRMLDEISKVGDLSEAIGLGTTQIQNLRFAFEQSGGSAQQADAAMQRFADTVVDAGTGTGQLNKWLVANNVAVRNADGSYKSMHETLAAVANLIQNAGSKQEAMNLATDAFGRKNAPAAVRALSDGAAGLVEWGHAAEQAGAVHTPELIAQAQKLDDEFVALTATIRTAAQSLAVTFAGEWKLTMTNMQQQTRGMGVTWREWAISVEEFFSRFPGMSESTEKRIEALRGEIGKLKAEMLNIPFEGPLQGGPQRAPTAPPADKVIKDPMAGASDQLEKNNRLLEAELRTVTLTVGEREKALELAKLEAAAIKAGLDPSVAITADMRQRVEEAGRLKQALSVAQAQFQEMNSASKEFGSALADSFKSAVLEGKKLDAILKTLINRLASKAIDRMFDMMFAPTPGAGGSSFFTNLLKGLTGKAAGGPVSGGHPYMVGERGAELFVPNKSGMIIPNKALAKGSGGTMFAPVTNIDARGSSMDEMTFRQILAANNRALLKQVDRGMPARQQRMALLGT